MDRILIDGTWYVKEESIDLNLPVIHVDEDAISEYQGMHYETRHYGFTAERYLAAGGNFYNGLDITFTDKRFSPHTEEIWDAESFFIGVLNDNEDSLNELRKSVCSVGEAEFKAFLKYLRQKEWL